MSRRYRMPRTLEESMDQAVVADRHKTAAAAAPIVSPAPPAVETDTPAAPPAAGDDLRTLPTCEGSGLPTLGIFGSLICSVCGCPTPRSHIARNHLRHPNPNVVAQLLAAAKAKRRLP